MIAGRCYIGEPAVSKEEAEDQNHHHHHHGKLPYNGYSDEFLDRLEPNGNIPAGKGDIRYGDIPTYGRGEEVGSMRNAQSAGNFSNIFISYTL
ncbi:unnamed protein product [Callosobruchus maculatus]|uniref:Uncharacterized protein n=1 Tax=Callosobruchus maculatus TaxID=64391 RepID=A0A653CJN0_CALMS|nr:unnamed protein product [Callosobruchus maculatus]